MTDACQILIVDDDADLLDLFSIALRRVPCQILKAASGQDALEMLKTLIPNLIILDVAMPTISGLDVLNRLRADQRFDQTFVVLLTAVPLMVDAESAALADRILVKPIAPSVLDSNIREVLASPPRRPTA